MFSALSVSALLMGLAGGPHCVAMCGAACGALTRARRAGADGPVQVMRLVHAGRRADIGTATSALHLGRVVSYAAAGALAAATAQGLGDAGAQLAALRPLWMMAHAAVLAWGLVLLVAGRQPLWSGRVSGWLATRLRGLTHSTSGLFATGLLWISMPCGLLYSALLLAALADGAVEGAVLMLLFALGSTASLVLAPWVWERLRGGGSLLRGPLGTRIAGLLLATVGAQAVWGDLQSRIAQWCV
ncbi:hypothetical protein RD110_08810 [Rhodoferax koreense]|uniref:Urease accessory protein UreH-like transmembrane domain-containing protein n=1 Tax=Rhodoferax koreensis TaxID=1842727 RepID=A0A1P8JUB1_9BURK|nr:sulfite exporter TauE/SafE family protein [Rhodoferax koreense]APW37281.1 hypothetical protein RD110_08810 [Rhodoferax koreense]